MSCAEVAQPVGLWFGELSGIRKREPRFEPMLVEGNISVYDSISLSETVQCIEQRSTCA
jgi:hypothetical protein